MKKLKVLWFAPFPYDLVRNTGSTKFHPAAWITELSKEIKSKVDLTIACWPKRKIKGVERFNKDGIEYVFFEIPRLRYDLLTLYKARINKFTNYFLGLSDKFDLVHVHGTEHQYEIVASRLGIPYIISIQGIISLCRSFYPNKLSGAYANWIISSYYEKEGIKRCKNFLCRTHFDKGYVSSLNPTARIFHNWELIRDEFFKDHFDQESQNLLFLGGTSKFKGFTETLRCLSELNNRGYHMKLRICGRGESQDIYRAIQEDNLNIKDNDIDFLGYQSGDRLIELFKDSFCMIHPSYLDNSPNSVCEAQVSGLPVIASNVGGVSALIQNNVSGLLVERYDHIGIADQICKLKEDRSFFQRISENSRSEARIRHSREQIVNNTMNAYNQIV